MKRNYWTEGTRGPSTELGSYCKTNGEPLMALSKGSPS